MFLRQVNDPGLAQNAYLIGYQRTGEAIVVDPERDIDRYLALAQENDLRLTAVAETHIHADYLSGARELVERHGLRAYLSAEGGDDWQFEWALGNPRVVLLRDGDRFHVGNIDFEAVLTAGHTPEHLGFLVTDRGGGAAEPIALLSGDFLFVGDVGRPDLLESAAGQAGAMGPAAATLYRSLRRTRELPGFLQILPAHGAGSACGKALGAVPSSVLDYERRRNPALRMALEGGEAEFVAAILDGQPEPPLYFARMKRDNRRGPAWLPQGGLPRPVRLHAGQLADWVGRPGRVALDLRNDRTAFMARHLDGALWAPLAGGHLAVAAGSYVDEHEQILLLVEREDDVVPVVRQLVRIGLDHVVAWMPVAEALAQPEMTRTLRRIPASALADELAGVQGAGVVLDVRGAAEHAAAHVTTALHIAHTRLATAMDRIPSAATVFVHCASGMRAALAAAFLARHGREVVHIDGDFSDIPPSLRS